MYIDQRTISQLSPALVRALRSVLYTSSIKGRYASNVENTLRQMGENKLAAWLKREAEAYNSGKVSRYLACDNVYDLSREYADPLA